jgi:hypothetical protein
MGWFVFDPPELGNAIAGSENLQAEYGQWIREQEETDQALQPEGEDARSRVRAARQFKRSSYLSLKPVSRTQQTHLKASGTAKPTLMAKKKELKISKYRITM